MNNPEQRKKEAVQRQIEIERLLEEVKQNQPESERRAKGAEQADLAELRLWLDGADHKKIVDAAFELASREDATVAPRLLEILRAADDPWVRNAAAMALAELEDPRAFDVIVALLKDERTLGFRSTLLYALRPFDCSQILPMLIDFVIEGAYEVAMESMDLIDSIDSIIDQEIWDNSIERIRRAIESATEERRPLLEDLLSLFEEDSSDDPVEVS